MPLPAEEPEEYLAEDVSLFELVDALHDILARTPAATVMDIMPDHLTVRNQMNVIVERLEDRESATFGELFEGPVTRATVIVTFLALLELIRLRIIRAYQAELFGTILISRTFTAMSDAEDIVDEIQ